METNLQEFGKNNILVNYIFGPNRKTEIIAASGIFNMKNSDIEDFSIYKLYIDESRKISTDKLDYNNIENFNNKCIINKQENGIYMNSHYNGEINGVYDGILDFRMNLDSDDKPKIEIISSSVYMDRNKIKNSEEYTETSFYQELILPEKFYFQILFPFTRVAPLVIISDIDRDISYDYNKHFTKDNEDIIFNSLFDTKYDIHKYERSNIKVYNDITINNPADIINNINAIYKEDIIIEDDNSFMHKNFRNGIDYNYSTDNESGITKETYSIDSFILEEKVSTPDSFIAYHKFIQILDDTKENVKEVIDLMERDLVSVESVPKNVLNVLFKYSTIYDENEIDIPDIIKYNTDEVLDPHHLYVKQWSDDNTYLFTSRELLEESDTESDNSLSYSVEIFGDGKYMREVYSYKEDDNSYKEDDNCSIITHIYDCDSERCIYTLNQTFYQSIFMTKLVSEYDNDGLKFRIIDTVEKSISGSPKSVKFEYESPELNIEIDKTNNTILNFSSSLFNISDEYVFIRGIYGNIEKLYISHMNK